MSVYKDKQGMIVGQAARELMTGDAEVAEI